jgi:hypothetical protein
MSENSIKTPFRQMKEAKELAIYNERKELLSQPGAMATAVDAILKAKYNIHSASTIWFVCKRVEKRLAEAGLK